MSGAEKGKIEKTGHGGGSGKEDGAKAIAPTFYDGAPTNPRTLRRGGEVLAVVGKMLSAKPVDEIDKDDGVVNHDTREGNRSHDGHQSHGLAGEK